MSCAQAVSDVDSVSATNKKKAVVYLIIVSFAARPNLSLRGGIDRQSDRADVAISRRGVGSPPKSILLYTDLVTDWIQGFSGRRRTLACVLIC
jgi:hypothetical protein